MADRIFDPDTFTPSATDFDGGWHTFGVLAELDEPADLVGGSAWFPNPVPANFRWIVYKVSDESVVAEVDLAALPSPTPGDWNDFGSAAFVSPGAVALDDAETYVVAYATNGDFTYRDTGLAFPYGTGVVRGVEGRFHNGGTGPEFPATGSSGFAFPADMLVDAGGGPVAVTGQSSAVAGARSTTAKITVTAGRSSATSDARSSAAKIAPTTGRSTATAAATTTAAKVVACTARCSAAASATAAAGTVRPAAGKATAVPSSIAAASKRATVAGTATGVVLASNAGLDVRAVTARCSGVATTTLRLRLIRRPNTGTIARPNTGVILRP